MPSPIARHSPRRLPLAAKVSFTLWMLCWVPVALWAYGPNNFLWLSNVAQVLLLYAVWRGDRLIASSQAGTVVFVGAIWTLDFAVALVAGGRSLTGVTAYMFEAELPLIARVMSLYHAVLPVFVLWLCHRLGYDGRGVGIQWVIATVMVFTAWTLTDPERNINYAFEPFGHEQIWLPHWLYVTLLALVFNPLLIFVPGHFLVRYLLGMLARIDAPERHS